MTSTRRPNRPGQQNENRRGEAAPSGILGLVLVAVAVALGVILLVKGGGIGFENDSKNVSIGKNGQTASTNTTESTVPVSSTAVAPTELKIAVLNAAGKNGFASQGANFLSVAGYPAVTPGNSATQVPTSAVYFAPGFENDAAAVAKVLSIGAVDPIPETPLGKAPADVPEGTSVVVVLGPDVEPVIGAAGDTTTTAPGG